MAGTDALRVVGVGAGGHARVLMDIVRLTPGLSLIGMIDADATRWGREHFGSPILGGEDELCALWTSGRVDAAFIGVGGVPSNAMRRRVFERVRALGVLVVSLVHPRACVADGVEIGEGCMIMGGSVVNPAATLGPGVIVNTGAIVEHDCTIGAFAHVCPGAVLGGTVRIGEEAFVGLGSRVIQGVSVGPGAVVGAGAVVLRDIPPEARVAGCPARPILRDPVDPPGMA